jgi:hypothetical protein
VICTSLDLPERMYTEQGHAQGSSEYEFIFICEKLAIGMTTVKLTTELGEFNHQHVSKMHEFIMVLLPWVAGWHLF